MEIQPPICIGEPWAFDFFRDVGSALAYLEPWYADEDYVAFDSVGTPLTLTATKSERSGFRLSRPPASLEIAPGGPPDADAAASLLRQYLAAAGEADQGKPDASLQELFTACIKHAGWTR